MDYQGCVFLQEGINFDLDTVCDCCISHNDGRGLPVLINSYNGELIDWDNLFEIKANRIEKQKKKTIFECENCYHLSDFKFTGERKISEFHFSHCRACNSRCIYCSDVYSEGSVNYNTYPVILDLIEKGYYKSGGEATFEGGEPTCMQNFDELIGLFVEKGTRVRVHTSGIKYSETVFEALKKGMGKVVISLDSGNSDTYKKIKRVDKFNIVCENIKKYAQASPEDIIIKYIIIPGINDSINEINQFFKLMKKFNINTVALDIELQYARRYNNKNVSPHIYLLTDYFNNKAKELNINVNTYSFLIYVLRNRQIKKLSDYICQSNFLSKLLIKIYNDKSKNIVYRR